MKHIEYVEVVGWKTLWKLSKYEDVCKALEVHPHEVGHLFWSVRVSLSSPLFRLSASLTCASGVIVTWLSPLFIVVLLLCCIWNAHCDKHTNVQRKVRGPKRTQSWNCETILHQSHTVHVLKLLSVCCVVLLLFCFSAYLIFFFTDSHLLCSNLNFVL